MDSMNFCQSCTMPLDNDPNKGGSEIDGSRSVKYCSFCYENGAFKDPEMTLEKMTMITKEAMEKQNIDQNIIDMSLAMLPTLERWKTAS